MEVLQPATRPDGNRKLALRIQRGTTDEGAGRAVVRRLREAVTVIPDSSRTATQGGGRRHRDRRKPLDDRSDGANFNL